PKRKTSTPSWPMAWPGPPKQSTQEPRPASWTAGSPPASAWAASTRRKGLHAQRERGLQVVPGVGPERDVSLGVGHAGDLIQPSGDDVGQLVLATDPDHGHQVEIPGDR